eukprot:scaffold30047_cov69-Phaeocystis_antarctica.AAC.1
MASWRPKGLLCAIIASIWRNGLLQPVVVVRWNCCCRPPNGGCNCLAFHVTYPSPYRLAVAG